MISDYTLQLIRHPLRIGIAYYGYYSISESAKRRIVVVTISTVTERNAAAARRPRPPCASLVPRAPAAEP